MPKFSQSSLSKLSTCHLDLQWLFNEVIKYFDCTIICGRRTEADQNQAFAEGKSKLKYPNSKHNKIPSLAIDVCPFPINWKDRDRFYFFGGFVKGIACQLGINIRWGGDWDGDTDLADQNLYDLPHYELHL